MNRQNRITIVGTGEAAQDFSQVFSHGTYGDVMVVDALADPEADPVLRAVFNPEGTQMKEALSFRETGGSDITIVLASSWLSIPETATSAALDIFYDRYSDETMWEDQEVMYIPRRSVFLACFDLAQHSVKQIMQYSSNNVLIVVTTPWLDEALMLGVYEAAGIQRNRVLGSSCGPLDPALQGVPDLDRIHEPFEIIESVIRDQKKTLFCAAYLEGEYGIHRRFAHVLCVIGRGGIERIIEPASTEIRPLAEGNGSWLSRWYLSRRRKDTGR